MPSAPQVLYTVWRTREKPVLGAWVQSLEQVALALELAALHKCRKLNKNLFKVQDYFIISSEKLKRG